MKKISIILALVVVVSLLTSCVPTEPKDILPFCKAAYEENLVTYPDLPPSWIGACVSNLQSGNYNAYAPLCHYEPFITYLQTYFDPAIETKEQCMQFLKTYGE